MQQHIEVGERTYCLERPADLETLWERLDEDAFTADERLPYWVEIWPASIFLARWLRKNKRRYQNRWCLDLGCGLGLTTSVASEFSSRVVGMDYEFQALSFARYSAGLNNLIFPNWLLMDWRDPGLKKHSFSCIWGADILYEARFFEPLLSIFQQLLAPGGTIWLSTPERRVSRPFWDRLKRDSWEVSCLDQEFIAYKEYQMQVFLYEIKPDGPPAGDQAAN
ncbi:MAG: class I SAM-dependent methyltransferase [Desulfohalobiaceae bacterium]|nr:class I SAM-dependent methyltransferase [Desulfohalobiaceae bacterium]